MRLIVAFLKTSAVIAIALLSLVLVSATSPLGGLYASLVIGVIAVISLVRPLPMLWLESRFTGAVVVVMAALTLYVSNEALRQKQFVEQQEIAAKNEMRLSELRSRNPKAYLEELKANQDSRWEEEFQALDKSAYDAFVIERRAKEEQARKAMIVSQIEQLKSIPAADLDGQYRIYTELVRLEPANDEHKRRRDNIEKQLWAKRDAKHREDDQKQNPERHVSIESFSWEKGGFENVMIANFSIKNSLPWAVKDIRIRCKHSAPSGTSIDENSHTVYERFEANKTKRLSKINMGFIHSQASRSGCEVVGVTVLR